ncbi:MAG TPA: hypothetical protein PLQ81_11555 [bacterium]|nr:hypothetical protein [bacterium]
MNFLKSKKILILILAVSLCFNAKIYSENSETQTEEIINQENNIILSNENETNNEIKLDSDKTEENNENIIQENNIISEQTQEIIEETPTVKNELPEKNQKEITATGVIITLVIFIIILSAIIFILRKIYLMIRNKSRKIQEKIKESKKEKLELKQKKSDDGKNIRGSKNDTASQNKGIKEIESSSSSEINSETTEEIVVNPEGRNRIVKNGFLGGKYIIDSKYDYFEYPRIGIARFISTLCKLFNIKFLENKRIKLSEIEGIYLTTRKWSSEEKIQTTTNKNRETRYVTKKHVQYDLTLMGDFGSLEFKFDNKNLRDKLCNDIEKLAEDLEIYDLVKSDTLEDLT